MATGDNHNQQCNVTDWDGIVAVVTGSDHTAGLKYDGTVVEVGLIRKIMSEEVCFDWSKGKAHAWEDIINIYSGDHCVLGLKKNGSVVIDGYNLLTRENALEFKVQSWKLFRNIETLDDEISSKYGHLNSLVENIETPAQSFRVNEHLSKSNQESSEYCKIDDDEPRISLNLKTLGKSAYTYENHSSKSVFQGTYFSSNKKFDETIRAHLLIPKNENIYIMVNGAMVREPFSLAIAFTDSGIYYKTKKVYNFIKWGNLKEGDISDGITGFKILGQRTFALTSSEESKLLLYVVDSILKNYDFSSVKNFALAIDKQLEEIAKR